MMTLEEKKQEVVDEFAMFEGWMDRYEYIIELGKNLDAYPEDRRTAERAMNGGQSRVLPVSLADNVVWLHEKLFGETGYAVSPEVQERSDYLSQCCQIGQLKMKQESPVFQPRFFSAWTPAVLHGMDFD